MTNAIAIFTGGITELRQVAVRSDGAVFSRMQRRDPRYGYQWSAWRSTGEVLGANAMASIDTMELGWATLRRATPDSANINARALFAEDGSIRVRLPVAS